MHGTRETIYTPRLTDIVKNNSWDTQAMPSSYSINYSAIHAFGDTPANSSQVPVVTTGNGKGALAVPCISGVALSGHSAHELLAIA